MNKKKIFIIVGIVLVILIGGILIYNLSRPKDLIGKVKEVEGIKFSDATITKDGIDYIFYVKVTTSKDAVKAEDFTATIYDKDDNIIDSLTGYIGDIDKNSKKEITITTNEDLSKAYEINYSIRLTND